MLVFVSSLLCHIYYQSRAKVGKNGKCKLQNEKIKMKLNYQQFGQNIQQNNVLQNNVQQNNVQQNYVQGGLGAYGNL